MYKCDSNESAPRFPVLSGHSLGIRRTLKTKISAGSRGELIGMAFRKELNGMHKGNPSWSSSSSDWPPYNGTGIEKFGAAHSSVASRVHSGEENVVSKMERHLLQSRSASVCKAICVLVEPGARETVKGKDAVKPGEAAELPLKLETHTSHEAHPERLEVGYPAVPRSPADADVMEHG
ncbi:hypothetical protein CALCODRAFT_506426 [Calocera cornea HHB12733]|uniref:Uncharacterized protein n=1 Tax=Calocera cornea HHB12733 TaxID=1353952 RepID=A0A165J0T6_9BASI|nr:hypothetical protein CALCODRAFT_506426 [Calocera cornea HHB12733]